MTHSMYCLALRLGFYLYRWKAWVRLALLCLAVALVGLFCSLIWYYEKPNGPVVERAET